MITSKIDKLIYAYTDSIYQHSKGFQAYSDERKADYMSRDVCYVYGELLYPSVVKMLKFMRPKRGDVLLDLGSGLGKFALQMFMRSPMQTIMGIEATEPLFEQSQKILAQAKQDFPFLWQERTLDVSFGNFLERNWDPANIVYSCSTCFTNELLGKIGEKINDSPHIKQAFSLRPIPTLKRLILKDVFAVECSWDSALCFWYQA